MWSTPSTEWNICCGSTWSLFDQVVDTFVYRSMSSDTVQLVPSRRSSVIRCGRLHLCATRPRASTFVAVVIPCTAVAGICSVFAFREHVPLTRTRVPPARTCNTTATFLNSKFSSQLRNFDDAVYVHMYGPNGGWYPFETNGTGSCDAHYDSRWCPSEIGTRSGSVPFTLLHKSLLPITLYDGSDLGYVFAYEGTQVLLPRCYYPIDAGSNGRSHCRCGPVNETQECAGRHDVVMCTDRQYARFFELFGNPPTYDTIADGPVGRNWNSVMCPLDFDRFVNVTRRLTRSVNDRFRTEVEVPEWTSVPLTDVPIAAFVYTSPAYASASHRTSDTFTKRFGREVPALLLSTSTDTSPFVCEF